MFLALGSAGQVIVGNPQEEVVIVKGALSGIPRSQPTGAARRAEALVFLSALKSSLHRDRRKFMGHSSDDTDLPLSSEGRSMKLLMP